MRLGLADVKKSVLRRDGEVYIAPQLLGPRAPVRQIAALIALYESRVGSTRATFAQDAPAELIGDYRLARCLAICLEEWYVWESPAWPGGAPESEARALATRGIASPGELRLALYDAVSHDHSGYLASGEREAGLDAFAAAQGLRRETLDALLYLDRDEYAVLRRVTEEAPAEPDVIARYNQQVFEALIANAARVEWTLPPTASDPSGGGLGAVVKRICFLARRMGVQYEVEFAAPTGEVRGTASERPLGRVAKARQRYAGVSTPGRAPAAAIASLDGCLRPLHITLYGPQEVTGAPNQYGQRLARLCRALLGYRRHLAGAALTADGLQGIARVYLHGRPVTFVLDDRLLRLLRGTNPADESAGVGAEEHLFDSSLEQGLHDEVAALERAGEAHGWHIEREPEPVIAGDTILIADFALTRGSRRVYLEIAGYWRPEYRERKLRKLLAVREQVALLVAVPESAREAFAALAGEMPLLWYRTRVSAHALLDALESAYRDFGARLAAVNWPGVLAEVQRRGWIPTSEAMGLLSCYTRNELAEAVARLQTAAAAAGEASTPRWLDGFGLCSAAWHERILSQVHGLVAGAQDAHLSLPELRERLVMLEPAFSNVAESQIETLARMAGLRVRRASIFDVDVSAAEAVDAPEVPEAPFVQRRKAQPRTTPRRKHRDAASTTPLAFPAERASDDGGK